MLSRTNILALVAIFLGVGVAGFRLGGLGKEEPIATPEPEVRAAPPVRIEAERPPATATESPRNVRQLEEEVAQLRREKAEAQQKLTDFLTWLIENYKGRYPLPESYLGKLRLSPVTGDFELHPEVAEILQVTPDEEKVLNGALQATHGYMQEMETELMTVREDADDRVVVHVPAFPEEGRQIRDDLLQAVQATLGAERFGRFLDVAQQDLDENFGQFGEQARTIIFEVVYPDGGDLPMLAIKDGWVQETDEGRVITATQVTVPELPEEYLSYIDWLTAYEAPSATP